MIVGSPDYELLETDGHQAKEKVNKTVIEVCLFVCLSLVRPFRGQYFSTPQRMQDAYGTG